MSETLVFSPRVEELRQRMAERGPKQETIFDERESPESYVRPDKPIRKLIESSKSYE